MRLLPRFLACVAILTLALCHAPALSARGPNTEEKPLPTVELPSLPEAKTTPWGKEVDGLSCRLILPTEVTHGQPIRLTIEVRNASKRTRYLCEFLDPRYKEHSLVKITGPDGKALGQSLSYGTNLTPQHFPALAPGETRRFDLPEIREHFRIWSNQGGEDLCKDAFIKHGKYTFTYTYRSPACPEKVVVGSRAVPRDGKTVVEPIFAEVTKEQLAGAFAGSLEAAPMVLNVRPLKPEDLTIHEWGVFTVFSDLKLANANRKHEWLSLPPDFYRQFPERRLVWQPAAWDKPIVYFYTKQPALLVEMQVRFRDGAPVVWWPACASPIDDGMGRLTRGGMPKAPREPKFFDTLRWSGWLGDIMPTGTNPKTGAAVWSKVQDFELPRQGWLHDARLPDAARFTVSGSKLQRGAPWTTSRLETERFIYYDGLVPAPDHLRCIAVTDTAVTVKNTAKFPVAQLFFVDRRSDRKNKDWAVAYRAEAIAAGGEATIELHAVPVAKDVASSQELTRLLRSARQALLDAGLYSAEADSLLKIWGKDFFEAEGLTAFFLLPLAEYDRMLPLEVTPAPAKRPVRVGIAHHPRFELGPRVQKHIDELIKNLDANTFQVREAANRELEQMGPWAIAQVRQALANKPSLETTRRLEALLERADASEWLRQTVPPAKVPGK